MKPFTIGKSIPGMYQFESFVTVKRKINSIEFFMLVYAIRSVLLCLAIRFLIT